MIPSFHLRQEFHALPITIPSSKLSQKRVVTIDLPKRLSENAAALRDDVPFAHHPRRLFPGLAGGGPPFPFDPLFHPFPPFRKLPSPSPNF